MSFRKSWEAGPGGRVRASARDGSFPAPADPPPAPPGVAELLGLALYALVVLFALRGLAMAPEGSWIGGGEIEGWLWRYWWMKEIVAAAFADGGLGPGLHTLLVAGSYPEFGNVLDLQVFSWPLEVLLGAPTYYTAKILLVLVLDCAAAGWFLSRVWGRGPAAWLGGLVFGLNPYFLYEVSNGRLRQAVAFTIPLFLLELYRTWREGDLGSTLRAGLFMGLTAAFYLYYGMFLGFFWVLFLAWHLLLGRRSPHARGVVVRLLAVAALGLLVTLPFVQSYLEMAARRDLPEVVPYGTAFPSLEELTTPAGSVRPRNLLWASQKRFLVDSLPLDALWNPAGRQALPLAVLLLVFVPTGRPRRVPWLWLATLALFLALSFGPYLKLGEQGFQFLGSVPMPYSLPFRWVPYFSRLFAPLRLEVMVYGALAVLACLRVRELAGERRGPAAALAGLVALALVAQLESSGVLPLPTVRLGVAPYYYLLADQPPTGLVEVPFKTGDYLEYNQTVHGQKVLWSFAEGGVPPGFPPGRLALLARKEGWRQNSFVTFLEGLNRDPAHPGTWKEADRQALLGAGYRLLLLHERGCYYLDPERGERIYFRLLDHFRKTLGEPLLHTDEPAYRGLVGRRRGDGRDPAWYRMAVFRLDAPPPGAILRPAP